MSKASETASESTDHDLAEKNKQILEFIEEVTSNADEIQRKVLEETLTRNANVEYLKRHGLDGRTDRGSFKKVMPVIEYEDIRADINRIANGDTSPILSSTPVSEFLTSSGTSGGERKLIPTIEEEFERRALLKRLLMSVMSQYVPGLEKGKGMHFLFMKPEAKTPGGLPARTVVTSSTKRIMSKGRRSHSPYTSFTSPHETILCPDSYQSMYAQMLCGLIQRNEVLRVGALFASGFIRAMNFLEKHWSLLCNDIRTGTVDARITDQDVRAAVMRILEPDLGLADLIECECKKESWQGIITRLWPNSKYVGAVVTGAMSQYIPALDYYSNGLPLVSTVYASSECFFGVNLNPLCAPSEVAYTLIPNMAYFEFLPVHRKNGFNDTINVPRSLDEKDQQELVDLVDVKLGQEYELVVTTYSGLYRYRVGDLLRVASFKNKAPQFNFICRKGVALSIDADKTDEAELQNAIQNAASLLAPFKASVAEYTSYADTATVPGHYVLYWELSLKGSTPIPPSVFEDCCVAIEQSLNSVYRQGRVSEKSIGPLEIKIAERGTFDKVMDYAVNFGTSIDQYKTPRCVKSAPIVALLNSRAVSSYLSPRCPNWVPQCKISNSFS